MMRKCTSCGLAVLMCIVLTSVAEAATQNDGGYQCTREGKIKAKD